MIWNNNQEGYINNFLSNFPLEKFVPIFLIIFFKNDTVSSFQTQKESLNSELIWGIKKFENWRENWNKLCSWTSESKRTYLEADFEVPNSELTSATI